MTLAPVWRDAGWPMSHEGPGFLQRTLVYARHVAAWDLMPIWSSSDAFGFGSPMPLMYHKLFYLVAGPLALLTGSLRFADVSTVALMLTVGAAGMFATARALQASPLAATVAGLSLIGANYTVTSWLVRGAVAEHSAMMVLPWVLYFFVASIRDGRLHVGMGAALGLMWLGHSVLAFYVGLLVATAGLVLMLARVAPWTLLNPRTAWPALLVLVVIISPYLAIMTMVAPAYDFSRILGPTFLPVDNFQPVSRYLWDRYWQFGRTESGLTVQLDVPMLALGALAIAHLVRRVFLGAGTPAVKTLRLAAPILMVGVLAWLLQLPQANAFYEAIPGALYIQFPWRLLAVLTPALILSAVCLADVALPAHWRQSALCIAATWMLAGSGAFVPIHDHRMGDVDRVSLTNVTFSGFREYEPAAAPPVASSNTEILARWREAGCTFERRMPERETIVVDFDASCPRTTTLPLPIYNSPLHAVDTGASGRRVRCQPLDGFPTLCGVTVPMGSSILSVQLPTVGAALSRAVLRRASR